MTESVLDRIRQDAGELGIRLSDVQLDLLRWHLEAVLTANKWLNLTAVTDAKQAASVHIVDSLAVIAHLPQGADRIADLGSGAGYPGVPVAIVTGKRVELVESVKKKADFLKTVEDDLSGLADLVVHPVRAEELASSVPGRFDALVARAVASLASLVELASPLLVTGGEFVAMKGSPDEEELRRGARAASVVGMTEVERVSYLLPRTGEGRTIVRYRKVSESTVPLPRRPGVAQKRPLG